MEKSLGEVISSRRKELNYSQREMARAVKISNSTVSRIENDDDITPDNATLRAIAEFLKLDYNYLLALNKQIENEPEIRIIQRAAKQMDSDQKEEMVNLLKEHFEKAFKNAEEDVID